MTIHFDPKNIGLDAICPFGDYSGGYLVIPSLGVVLNSTANTLNFLESMNHPHFVTSTQGRRFSLVGFSHQTDNQAFGQQRTEGTTPTDKLFDHLPLIEFADNILKSSSIRFSNYTK